MPAEPVSRPWRRHLRISMRGMIILVLVIGAAAGWIARGARIQREAVAAITRNGGQVTYTWGAWRTGDGFFNGTGPARKGLVDFIGVDYFGHISTVFLNRASVDADAAIAQVGRLDQLQFLDLDQSNVSDPGLAQLKGMTELWVLCIDDTRISDAGLVHLKALPQLEALRLEQTQVTDAGLAHLETLRNLTFLSLDGTSISGPGLIHLQGLPRLSQLFLSRTGVIDSGLAHLRGLNNLSRLELRGTRITDSGLAHLKGLTKLSVLDLSGTQVTDSGLPYLKGLTNLAYLDLHDTKVTDAGMKSLMQALPNVKVLHQASGVPGSTAPRRGKRGRLVPPSLPARRIQRSTASMRTPPSRSRLRVAGIH